MKTLKQRFVIKWTVNKYRQDKRTGPIQAIKRNDYMKQLFQEEEKRIRG